MNVFRVIDPPDATWLSRLRRGHLVWLVKEKTPARVEFAWEPPAPGCTAGCIGLEMLHQRDDGLHRGALVAWWVSENGRGMDNSQLLKPIEDNCPDEAPPISDVWQRHVERTLSQLVTKMDQLEADVYSQLEHSPGYHRRRAGGF